MFTSMRRGGGKLSLMVLALTLAIWAVGGTSALAHGGGGGGGGHGGGGGGGHMGGFGGGMGGFGGGFGGRGFGGGFGGRGFGGFGGFGYGGFCPYYGLGYGYGLGGYGLGYGGLGYGGLGYGYGGLGYGGYGLRLRRSLRLRRHGLRRHGLWRHGLWRHGYGGMGYGGMGYGGMGYPANGFGYSSAYVAPAMARGDPNHAPTGRILGIDEEPTVLSDGRKGMKITNVYAGTAARTSRSSGRRRASLGEWLPDRTARQSGLDHRQCHAQQCAETERSYRNRRPGPDDHGQPSRDDAAVQDRATGTRWLGDRMPCFVATTRTNPSPGTSPPRRPG